MGGDPLAANREIVLPRDALVIAADSGLHHAADLNIAVDIVIGDMDSVDPTALANAVNQGSRTETHPFNKDRTDLELAIDAALKSGARNLLIVGAHTGRLDHLLGAMGLFAATANKVDEIVWTDGLTEIFGCVPGHPTSINGRVGDGVSLVPACAARFDNRADVLVSGPTDRIGKVNVAPEPFPCVLTHVASAECHMAAPYQDFAVGWFRHGRIVQHRNLSWFDYLNGSHLSPHTLTAK